MFDSHVHTHNSNDCSQTFEQLCISAIGKGIKAISVTDHVDMWFLESADLLNSMKNCVREVKEARQKYGERLEILQGIELAEYLYDPKNADKILALSDFDVILGSVHSLNYGHYDYFESYSRLDFSKDSETFLYAFLGEYFSQMFNMAKQVDFDVLAHLNCPIRYMNGKYNRNMDILKFEEEIREILKCIIRRDIALEVNTSGIGGMLNDWMPNLDILRIYNELGGKLITMGSDAHVPENVGIAFGRTKEMLKNEGFNSYYYFKKRKPIEIALD